MRVCAYRYRHDPVDEGAYRRDHKPLPACRAAFRRLKGRGNALA